ncbi:UNVERIFIED_CONTAM: hypothetical protein GTU68_051317, partial [Idotea baltica]|nr:hypothetical protein [Idotea baltica]
LFCGISQLVKSENPTDEIIATNLGSCLGIAIYDPKRKVGGIVHALLPTGKKDPEKAKEKPFMYVDSGVSNFIQQLVKEGSNTKHLIITVAGGANINDHNNVFEIGKRNFTILRKILWKNNLPIKAQDVGGSSSRTLKLSIKDGTVSLKTKGNETILVNGDEIL